ncbi:MAG: hydrogenase [Candidatus Thermoplasmatota archaeon]
MFTLETGSGFWNPLLWLLVFVVVLLFAYILRGLGNRKYKKGTDQTKSFLSGNPEPKKELMHVKSDNLYWGFTEAMEWIYNLLKKMHTGNVSDYVLWFVVTLAVLLIIIGGI